MGITRLVDFRVEVEAVRGAEFRRTETAERADDEIGRTDAVLGARETSETGEQ